MHSQPLISIVTAVYNGEQHLENTIKSIINQTYENLEYIIIDGGSSDGTIEIIKRYEQHLTYWVSEKDQGISDAFNKGIMASKGDYINFQGDGDGFCNRDSISDLFQNINIETDIFVSGRIKRTSQSGKEIFTSPYINKFNKKTLLFKMSLPHQGLFTSKKYFKKYGLFDVNNIFCMDYEHLLRAYANFPKVITKNTVVANWRDDGLGNGRTLEIFKEYDKIKRDNFIAPVFVLNLIKYFTLLKFYIKKVVYHGK